MTALCQRCGESRAHWSVHQAEFTVGRIKYWKVQLCEACAEHVEKAIHAALRTTLPPMMILDTGTGEIRINKDSR